MKNAPNNSLIVLLLTILTASMPAAANERFTYDVDLEAGTGWDSNVGLSEIDANTDNADQVTNVQIGAGIQTRHTDDLRSVLRYDYSDTSYEEYSEFDLGLHQFQAELTTRFGLTDVGLMVNHFDGNLDGDDYLSLTRIAPNVSRLFNNRWFLRAAYVHTDTSYDEMPERDASGLGLRTDAYYLLQGMEHYAAFSFALGREDAEADELDYNRWQIGVTYAFPIRTNSFVTNLKLRARYEDRSYRSEDPVIGAARSDTRMRYSIEADMPLADRLGITSYIDWSSSDSNLEAADYDKRVAGIRLTLEF
ncbi:MAG: DUF560 domain-containing protein [Gammaproteobacteria bacterium]|nr:DUF560 domain-containing protein [Gammaproteobacteria bacterium]